MNPKLKLTYFDLHGGRGETARMALHIGGIDYEDDRVPPSRWKERRAATPYQEMPVLEVDGRTMAQSNAINRYVGKLTGLYPDDPFEAALCDEAMDVVEDVAVRVLATFGMEDPQEVKAKRTALVEGPVTRFWGALGKRLASRGDWFADGRLTVADLKVFLHVRHVKNGGLEHVDPDLPELVAPPLAEHFHRMREHDAVKRYYAYRGVDAWSG